MLLCVVIKVDSLAIFDNFLKELFPSRASSIIKEIEKCLMSSKLRDFQSRIYSWLSLSHLRNGY